MAVPKRRTSKTKKRMRRTHYKIDPTGMIKCPNCGELIKPHRVCPDCGFYKGSKVISEKASEEETEAK